MRLREVVAGLLVAVGCGVGAGPARACSVAVGPDFTPAGRVADARAAATVRVLSVRFLDPAPLPGLPTDANRRYEAVLGVSRVYKGSLSRRIRVRGATASSLCEFGPLHRGGRFGLVLSGARPYRLGILSRISRADLERATGGRSHPPRS